LSDNFYDTSALVKYYIIEVGSAWVTNQVLTSSGNRTMMSNLALVEMISVFMRKEREGALTSSDRIKLQNDFMIHTQKLYTVIRLTKAVFTNAQDLVVRHPLRTLDAIQLTSALQAKQLSQNLTFISADLRLLAAAQAEGLQIDNPNNHP